MRKKKIITPTHTYFEETSSIYIDNEIGVISLATARLSRRSLFVFDNGWVGKIYPTEHESGWTGGGQPEWKNKNY